MHSLSKPLAEAVNNTLFKDLHMTEPLISATLPGTFYRRPPPNATPHEEEGKQVAPDTVSASIAVMKQCNEMTAEHGGCSLTFLQEDDEPVEIDQSVAKVAT